jgi:hypothetical protein
MKTYLMHMIFSIYCLFQSRAKASAHLRREAEMLTSAVREMEEHERRKRLDVGPMTGVDEDMQDWSALMILEHMTLVNRATKDLLGLLHSEKKEIVRTDVKNDFTPHKDAGEEWIEAFETSVEDYLKTAEGLASLKTRSKFAHPVFGNLNAFQVHCFGGVHHALHRKQLDRLILLIKEEAAKAG